MTHSRAKVGGEIGVNGFCYKGGQFLPSTQAEPGRWKIGKKWVVSGRELTEPGKWEYQPTPFSRSILVLCSLGAYTNLGDDGRLKVRDGGRAGDGTPVSSEMQIRPGVKGYLGEQTYTLQELIDLYHRGARWIDVNPQTDTLTTK